MATTPAELAEDIELSEEESIDSDVSPDSPDDVIEDQLVKQPFRIVYQTNNFLLPQLKDLITTGDDVNLRPEYQRRLRWNGQQKSRLIESLLLNVPVPPVFFYENDLARYEVMDGQQRLNAIKEFLGNEFPLRGLQIISSLNGKTYAKLSPKVKRSLDRSSISAIVLLQESQGKIRKAGSERFYELRRFVFERLNTGGKRLTAQEIRNAVYGGEFNNLIVKLSRNKTFTSIWGIPPYVTSNPNDYYEEEERQRNSLYKTMGDCQLILRFFALENEEHIQSSLRSILDRCMERYADLTSAQCAELEKKYESVLNLAYELFDGKPFSLRMGEQDYRPLAGIYDGVMISLNEIRDKDVKLLRNRGLVQQAYRELVETHGQRGTLTGVASTASDIKGRVALFRGMFAKFI